MKKYFDFSHLISFVLGGLIFGFIYGLVVFISLAKQYLIIKGI